MGFAIPPCYPYQFAIGFSTSPLSPIRWASEDGLFPKREADRTVVDLEFLVRSEVLSSSARVARKASPWNPGGNPAIGGQYASEFRRFWLTALCLTESSGLRRRCCGISNIWFKDFKIAQQPINFPASMPYLSLCLP